MPPPRRPTGPGPGLGTTLTACIFFLPLILTAAQQQQPLANADARSRSPPAEARVDTAPPVYGKPHHGRVEAASKRSRPSTSYYAQNERAVATKVSSAPAVAAVRAPPAGNAASDGLSQPSARSLKDWEVEDFVLLATVDGHIHARDRYNGDEIWEMRSTKPMLETIYNTSEGDNSLRDQDFIFIVEPKEQGALYVLHPGPYPLLQSLGMTVKQLADELAPYSGEDPPVVWTAEKKNYMLIVDAKTGNPMKSFSPSGSAGIDTELCVPQGTEYFQNQQQRECRGYFHLGQTEYVISIHDKLSNHHLCTIKYSEWTTNNRDRDLQGQYLEPADETYIYPRFDGQTIAYDHRRSNWYKRPVFDKKLPYPVVRVWDVARAQADEEPDPALVLLPQPPGPISADDRMNQVWLNTTDTGAWYALSEQSYPAVTEGAPPALCYTHNDILSWEGPFHLPDRKGLVGVHELGFQREYQDIPQIAPTPYDNGKVVPLSPDSPPALDPPPAVVIESTYDRRWLWAFSCFVLISLSLVTYSTPAKPRSLINRARSYLSNAAPAPKTNSTTPAASEGEKQSVDGQPNLPSSTEISATESTLEKSVAESTVETAVKPSVNNEAKEKKVVSFDIPEDDEADLSPLSRTTTGEQASPLENGDVNDVNVEPRASNGTVTQSNTSETTVRDMGTSPATPTKKKKTHRGKRGGAKLKNKKKDEEEVDRIIDAAKQLDPTPTLHPDEVTINGGDMQDISNIKKIGKLTIDFDRLLGNGSGGTFVFEGKWNEREVAIKRMLPQYFGLAEQEVKLLQESDLHPNVIRYFDDEKDENFLYIAVELCQASLFDLYRDGRPGDEITEIHRRLVNQINSDVPRALYQLALGLNHLHSLRIIHRDIKPQNILIAYPQRNQKSGPRLVISDFGLCKTLPDNVSTLIGTTGNAGTVGWKAPELILQPKDIEKGSSTGQSRDSANSTDPVSQGVKRAVDIFSLGCVFFYVLTNGAHPFDDEEGWMQIREYNIKKEKHNLKQLYLGDDSEEPIHLIGWMLSNHPEYRPTALQVMNHPFFWSAEKRLNFLCDCSDHWEREPRDPPSVNLSILEQYGDQVLDSKRNFLAKLDHGFVASLGKQRKYTGDRMLDLLRALRNKKNHYEDMDETIKARVGPLPHGYLRYWTTKFPRLLISCYQCVVECKLKKEPRFRPYFEEQTD